MDLTPMEFARRAYVQAEGVVDTLRSYCQNPTDPQDYKTNLSPIIADLDEVADQLHSVEGLLGTHRMDEPPADLLAAVRKADDVVTLRVISTQAKYQTSLEADLVTLRGTIGSADPSRA